MNRLQGIDGPDSAKSWWGEAFRFTVVSGGGVAVDLGLNWMAHSALGLNLYLSTALGFATAGVFNYALHRTWTFQGGASGRVGRQGLGYALAGVVTLLVRYAVIAALHQLPLPDTVRDGFLTLLIAVGASFAVNFLVCRNWVFRGRG